MNNVPSWSIIKVVSETTVMDTNGDLRK